MNTTIVAVILAKDVFQIAVADDHWRVVQTARLNRRQFAAWFENRLVSPVLMEACGSARHWARWLNKLGIQVTLLPAAYVRAYVKRNKTDAAEAACALANKMACICYAVMRDGEPFGQADAGWNKKINRQAFEMAS